MSFSKAPSAEIQGAVIDKYLTEAFIGGLVRRSGLAAPRGPLSGLRPVIDQAEGHDH